MSAIIEKKMHTKCMLSKNKEEFDRFWIQIQSRSPCNTSKYKHNHIIWHRGKYITEKTKQSNIL